MMLSHDALPPRQAQPMARLAGVLYLAIILLGLTSELALRGALLVPGDAAATAERTCNSICSGSTVND